MWNSYLWPIGTCWLTMKKFYLLQRPPAPLRCPWEEWYTDDSLNQAKTSSHAVKKKLELVYTHTQKKNCAHAHSYSVITMLMPGPLWVCLALMWVGSCHAHSLFTCEPIRVHRCLETSYNMTFFPNMMGHYDQDIAYNRMQVSPRNITQHLSVEICMPMHRASIQWFIFI